MYSRRSRRRCRQLQHDYTAEKLPPSDLVQRLQSWEAHLLRGDTHRLRQRLFDQLMFAPPLDPLASRILMESELKSES